MYNVGLDVSVSSKEQYPLSLEKLVATGNIKWKIDCYFFYSMMMRRCFNYFLVLEISFFNVNDFINAGEIPHVQVVYKWIKRPRLNYGSQFSN